ncbi:hypothetical protein ACFYTQ_08425 [Nocardia sp. NPDC004068]|uniref:hypothetical protein n=1 Tax=Nocardia sp. NPDC004068 TaxID=3364303 RepID=UPI0036827006
MSGPSRDRARSFGPQAAAYARYRPDYPPAAISWALEPLRHTATAEVLGRISDYLRERPETATGEFDMPLRTLVIRAVVA